MDKDWKSASEASLWTGQLLPGRGISRERVVRLAQRGEIRAQHLGGRWFVSTESLRAYLRRQLPEAMSQLAASA